jgi:hypothetical protein
MPTLRIRGVVRFPRERVLRWLATSKDRHDHAFQLQYGSEHKPAQARPPMRAIVVAHIAGLTDVLLQHVEPVGDVGGMILARLGGESEVGAEEGGSQLGHSSSRA